MPIPVACQCGQKFAANENLAGKKIKCPKCGGPLFIPPLQSPSAPIAHNMPFPSQATQQPGVGFSPMPQQQFPQQQFPQQPFPQQQFPQQQFPQQQFPQQQFPQQQYPGAQMGMPQAGLPQMNAPQMDAPGQSNWEMDWQSPAGGSFGSPYPQHSTPAPKKKSSKGLMIGLIVGSGTALVGIIVIVVIMMTRSSDNAGQEVARQDPPRDLATQNPVPTTPTPSNAAPAANDPTATSTNLPSTNLPSTNQPSTNQPSTNQPSTNLPTPNPVTGTTQPPTVVGPQVPATTNPSVPNPMNPVVTPSLSDPARLDLAASAHKWYSQPTSTLRGAQSAEQDDLVLVQYSWMCNLLPYVGHQELYDKFDFKRPWTRDPNLTLTREVVEPFLNPADNRKVWTGLAYHGLALTHFVGVAGVEDMRNDVAAKLPRSDPRAGVFGYDQVAKISEITDGTSQTIMIIGSGEFANPWVQGGGATIRGARQPYFDDITGFGSQGTARKGAFAVMADGSTRFIPADIDPTVFRAMCTIHGSETVDTSAIGPELKGFRN